MTAQVKHLQECCQRVVAAYLLLFNPPRAHATLFCPECQSRIVNYGSSWETE